MHARTQQRRSFLFSNSCVSLDPIMMTHFTSGTFATRERKRKKEKEERSERKSTRGDSENKEKAGFGKRERGRGRKTMSDVFRRERVHETYVISHHTWCKCMFTTMISGFYWHYKIQVFSIFLLIMWWSICVYAGIGKQGWLQCLSISLPPCHTWVCRSPSRAHACAFR